MFAACCCLLWLVEAFLFLSLSLSPSLCLHVFYSFLLPSSLAVAAICERGNLPDNLTFRACEVASRVRAGMVDAEQHLVCCHLVGGDSPTGAVAAPALSFA